jgi:hypothetical protein
MKAESKVCRNMKSCTLHPAAFRREQDVQMLTHLASCLIACPLFGNEASELGFCGLLKCIKYEPAKI